MLLGYVPDPLIPERVERQDGVRFGQRIVNLNRLARRGNRFRANLVWRHLERRAEHPVGMCHADMCKRVGGVGIDGLFEVAKTGLDAGLGHPEQMKATLEVEFVGVDVRGPMPEHLGPLAAREVDLQRLQDGDGNLVLHVENVAHLQLAVVPICPEMVPVGRVDQLRGDAKSAAGLAHASFEDHTDAELRGDVANLDLPTFEGKRRRARRDADPPESR